MDPIPKSNDQLEKEIKDLRSRLDEAEETIRAIRSGEVDALVVSTAVGEQVFTLQSADYYYRVLIEAMSEGAVTLDSSGMVLYSNSRFAELVGTPLQKVIGASFHKFVLPGEQGALNNLLQQGMENPCRAEFILSFAGDGDIPVLLSIYPLAMDPPAVCIIVSDQSEQKRAEEQILEQNRVLGYFNKISTALNDSLDVREILVTVQDHLRDLVGIPAGTIYLFNKETGKLEVRQRWHDEQTAGLALPLPGLQNLEFERIGAEFSQLKGHDLPTLPDGRIWSRVRIPLMAQTQLQGIIDLILRVTPTAVQQRIEIIEMFGRELGMALHNAQLYDAELKSRNLAETLRDASQALARSLSLDSVLNTFLDLIGKLVPFDYASISLYDNELHLVPRIERGDWPVKDPATGFAHPLVSLENPIVQAVMAKKHSLAIDDIHGRPAWDTHLGQFGIRSWACVPILADDKIIAICGLSKNEPGFFNADRLQWVDILARSASVAIQNAWLFEQVRAGKEKLQSLTRRLVEVQENERRYVAQELHDDAGQALTSLILRIGRLKQDVSNPEAVNAHAGYLGEEAASVLENLRRLAMDLRPATLDHLGLVAALRQYSEIIASQCNVDIQFEAIGLEKRLPDHTEVALYRIVQEALTNVIRHARASRVDILLERHEGRIVIMVEDNGIGFAHNLQLKPGHLGLIGMQERAEMLGGKLTVETQPGKGTTILIEIPEVTNNEH